MRGLLNSAFEGYKTFNQIFYQDASDAEQKVKELQDRVGNLMIVILDHVTLKNEEGDYCEDWGRDRTRYQRATQVRPTNGCALRLLMTLQHSLDN